MLEALPPVGIIRKGFIEVLRSLRLVLRRECSSSEVCSSDSDSAYRSWKLPTLFDFLF